MASVPAQGRDIWERTERGRAVASDLSPLVERGPFVPPMVPHNFPRRPTAGDTDCDVLFLAHTTAPSSCSR